MTGSGSDNLPRAPNSHRRIGLTAYSLYGHGVGGAVEQRTLAGVREAEARFKDPEHFNRLAKWHGDLDEYGSVNSPSDAIT